MIATLWHYLLAQINNNNFFSGAALAGVLLASLNYLRAFVVRGVLALSRRLVVSLAVHSEDPLYVPLQRWLKANRFDAYAQRYRLRTPEEGDPNTPAPASADQGPTADEPVLGPDYGTYLFRYAGRWLQATVVKEDRAQGQGSRRGAQTREFLTLRYLGVSRSLLDGIVRQVRDDLVQAATKTLRVRQANMYGWIDVGTIPRHSGLTCPVVLAGNLLQEIVDDIELFFSRPEWYAARGIPWRRGYLLFGPPGTGKTSLVRYLARHFGLSIYVVDGAGYMNENLGSTLKAVQQRSLILFEDIDRHDIGGAAKAAAKGDASLIADPLFSMNLGTLLNALDGLSSPERTIVFMTSNHPERLDDALIRPGRIDRKVHLANCTPEHATKMLGKFFPNATRDELDAFEAAVPDGVYSPAELQDLFMVSPSIDDVMHALRRPRPHLIVNEAAA